MNASLVSLLEEIKKDKVIPSHLVYHARQFALEQVILYKQFVNESDCQRNERIYEMTLAKVYEWVR